MDGVQKADSGHPGMPMGMATVAHVLWTRFLRHNPTNPKWFNRDRFVLSGGHGSMLLYSLLHLAGYDLPLDQLKQFRQLGSLTPGHPEYGVTVGVETTTGPLGQGYATGVGMALAEAHLAATYNRPGYPVVDHYVYAIGGDGCMQEGISHEAASLAGHLKLGKLIYFYDDNSISIDGPTSLSYSDNVPLRFEAYGWHVQTVSAYDMPAIDAAIRAAQAVTDRPSLVITKSHIAYGSPNKQDTAEAHGSPLGVEEIRLTKLALGLPPDEQFWVPGEVYARYAEVKTAGGKAEAAWNEIITGYTAEHPEVAASFKQALSGELPVGWDADLPVWKPGDKVATRSASGKVLDALAPRLPALIGGSADLTPSNNTRPKGAVDIKPGDFAGRYIRFGIREHGMGAMLNGLALHGGMIPYGGTFLVFSDYMRGAVRLSALMKAPVVYVWTHDSVGVGEDGPTHQPIEHMAALRCMPNLVVFRPGDANETAAAWRYALTHRNRPVALLLSRQNLTVAAGSEDHARHRAWRLHPGRRGGREARSHPDRRGIGSRRGVGRARFAGRAGGAGPGGQHAELGAVRRAGRGLPRERAARGGDGASFRRGRRDYGLAALCRQRRRNSWHRPLRRVGQGAGSDGAPGDHAGERGAEGDGAVGQMT